MKSIKVTAAGSDDDMSFALSIERRISSKKELAEFMDYFENTVKDNLKE
jgi:hypothetical protein